MLHHQRSHVSSFSRPIRRDFISLLPRRGLDDVAENILSYLDAKSLCAAELVCKEWPRVISEGMLWKKLIEGRVRTDSLWRGLMERQGWIKYLFRPSPGEPHPDHTFYRCLYPKIIQDIENIGNNWRCIGGQIPKVIHCHNENSVGVRCVQYDDHKIVSGLNNGTIKFWDRNTLKCIRVLTGHTEPVACLQFDDRIIISGSFDSTVRVWDVKTGELINTIPRDSAVLNLRFNSGMMVSCSEDRSVTVWNMVSPSEVTIRRVLVDPTDTVNVDFGGQHIADFDEKYIVSACGPTIKVWNTSTCELVRYLKGHKLRVHCLQYREGLVVSGSRDIKLWDIESGACLRTLECHGGFVLCIQFDNKRIVSGTMGGQIKVWDLAAALDPRVPAGTLCLGTAVKHSCYVYSLQFDDFQIVSCSRDGTILIFDFLNGTPPETCRVGK